MKMTNENIKEKAVLVGVIRPFDPKCYSGVLAELESLAETAGVEVLAKITQSRRQFHPGTYTGKGKVEEIRLAAEELGANVIIYNNDLTPGQGKKLETLIGIRVIDRTELILHIFASHAQTKEARLQVELAQMEYSLPRLKRMWTHLDRHEGAVGTRGPGEKQLETDKRIINKRIRDLTRDLREIQARKVREVQARNTKFDTIGLVGYTNAGKSTLMNALTDADAMVEDMLFATLDTKTRVWKLENGRKIMLSDTVGFIDKLPHHLVASFKTTLEEAAQSDILLHVVDISHPDAENHINTVNRVLKKIGLKDKKSILVFNKLDKLEDKADLTLYTSQYPDHIVVSAKEKYNIRELEQKITKLLEENMIDLSVVVPASNGKLISWMEQYGRVLNKTFNSNGVEYLVRLSEGNASWLKKQHEVVTL